MAEHPSPKTSGAWSRMSLQAKVGLIVSLVIILGQGVQLLLNHSAMRDYLRATSALLEEEVGQIEKAGEADVLHLQETARRGMANFEEIGRRIVEDTQENIKGNFQLIQVSLIKSINHMMITGHADIVGEWLDGQKEVSAFKRVAVLRVGKGAVGKEAFTDNETIKKVNQILGGKTFELRREAETEITLTQEESGEALRALQARKETFFSGKNDKGEAVTTMFAPVPNLEECHACHGADHEFRGLLVVTISREKAVSEITEVEARVKQEKEKEAALLEERTASIRRQGETEKRNVQDQLAAFDKKASRDLAVHILLAIINIGVALAILFFFLRASMIIPIRKTASLAERIADGDLSGEELDISTEDEVGMLGKALNKMKNNLRDMIRKVKESAGEVAHSANEISGFVAGTSSGVERQSAQISSVVASEEEMAATVVEVARNSSDAAASANKARDAAQGGMDVVETSIGGMRRISESLGVSAKTIEALGSSSAQIGEIVKVIDDIADQTNLLALNAAIEAARAGEQGRGFAVVADEVRKLAERTSGATQEIAVMIQKIQKDTKDAVASMRDWTHEVNEGVKLSNSAGDSLREIVNLINNVSGMISHIATATEEQSASFEEISLNMESISGVSEETAKGAVKTKDASQRLSDLAANLQTLVGQFRL